MAATMRAFVLRGPNQAVVEEVARPVAAPGEVVVDVQRAGVCGTDVEFFTGQMAYLASGEARYPIRLGHEWAGTVTATGDGVDPSWRGRRVMGDTMLGDGVCDRCRDGRQHLCQNRYEVGIRRGWPGALAEQVRVPAWSLHALPDDLDWTIAALVEPAGNAWRAVETADLGVGRTLLVIGAGTIGLLASSIARAQGADVTIAGHRRRSIDFARSLGFATIASDELARRAPTGRGFDAVIDASNDSGSPARTIDLVEPGRRVVWIGLAGDLSPVDSRRVVLADLSVVGILSGSGGLAGAIELFASGRVDPRPLVAAIVGLDDVGRVLAGQRDPSWGPGPKIQVDPRR